MQVQDNSLVPAGGKRLLALALLFMMVGTVMELYLLDHYEDSLQLIPIVCLSLSLPVLIWLIYRPTRTGARLFKSILGLAVLSGFYGIYLHLQANFEFEKEMQPGAENWDLLVESFSGALPALAPGSMIAWALIGYSYLKLQNKT